jgi:hypothetical protein
LQIVFVLYIFSRLNDRFEIIVVAILGMIYVTIVSINLNAASMMASLVIIFEKDIIFIRKKLGDDVSERLKETREAESKMLHAWLKVAISGFSYFLIGLICLYQLFSVL